MKVSIHLSTCARGRHVFQVRRGLIPAASKVVENWVPSGSRTRGLELLVPIWAKRHAGNCSTDCTGYIQNCKRGCRTEAVHGPFGSAAPWFTLQTLAVCGRQSMQIAPPFRHANQRGLAHLGQQRIHPCLVRPPSTH